MGLPATPKRDISSILAHSSPCVRSITSSTSGTNLPVAAAEKMSYAVGSCQCGTQLARIHTCGESLPIASVVFIQRLSPILLCFINRHLVCLPFYRHVCCRHSKPCTSQICENANHIHFTQHEPAYGLCTNVNEQCGFATISAYFRLCLVVLNTTVISRSAAVA